MNKPSGVLDECPHCHVADGDFYVEDVGIGSYEFWGQKCCDTNFQAFCGHCDECVTDNVEWFEPGD